MRKHTPGPWFFCPWHIEEGPSAVRAGSIHGWFICTTASDDDASLISAAPDMLEALELHAEWAKREHDGPIYPDGTSRDTPGNEAIWHDWFYGNIALCGRAEKATIAAIAKAKGEA